MTAVVGIMNTHGVAIAADSAVTISGSNGRKIFNTANKIFTLSKAHPVGIMIYNSASLMLTPWEVIIKHYRNHLKETSFATVKAYQEDFIEYLKKHNYFNSKELQATVFNGFVARSINELSSKILTQKGFQPTGNNVIDSENIINILKPELEKTIETFKADNILSIDFQEYSMDQFLAFAKAGIDACSDKLFAAASQQFKPLLYEILFYYIKSRRYTNGFTGLIFTGYGEEDIYPSSIALQIGDVFDDKLRYFIELEEAISDQNIGSILPFAQRDVIDTIISGVNPELDEIYKSTLFDFLSDQNKILAEQIQPVSNELAGHLNQLDINEIVNNFAKKINEYKLIKHIRPTVDTVAILSKEDLAEMAESLIYLTYLKRRMSFAEESVGGPVDVAVISKGDGFIWIKRKLYFKPELNQHFFQNYFK
jgi:hypothetical protein